MEEAIGGGGEDGMEGEKVVFPEGLRHRGGGRSGTRSGVVVEEGLEGQGEEGEESGNGGGRSGLRSGNKRKAN